MENFKIKLHKFNDIIIKLIKENQLSRFRCGLLVSNSFKNSTYFRENDNGDLIVGKFKNVDVELDVNLSPVDLRIFDQDGKELINLCDFGFECGLWDTCA